MTGSDWSARAAVPVGDAVIRSTTWSCSAKCSGCLRTRASNPAGIKRIIELTNQVEALQSRLKEMANEIEALRANQRRDLAVVPKSTAVVVWKPRR